MERNDVENRYSELGLEVRRIVDKPGKVYRPHRHEGVFLFTLKGSAKIKLDDGEWQTTEPGDEIHIEDDQLHEAVSGVDGWEYLFAASTEEMERQGL
jgi:quercetin dioxygenase-like cupin family protein